jgi:hypothetical protein
MFGIRVRDLGLDGSRIAAVTGLLLGNSSSLNPAVGATFSIFENLLIQGTFRAIDIQKGSEQNHFSNIVIGGYPNRLIVPESVGVCVACAPGSTHVTTNYFDRMTFGGHDKLVVIGGRDSERPVTTTITNSVFNVTDKGSIDIALLNCVHTVIENNYFESDTSVRTPIVLGDPAYAKNNWHIPQGTLIRQNLFSGGDSTGRSGPFINAYRFNKLWIVDNLYGGALPGPLSIFLYNNPVEGWDRAHSGGTYLHNRAASTGVAVEIGPTLEGWDVVELQGGTPAKAFSDSHPYVATDVLLTRRVGVGTTDPKVSGTGLFHASGNTARPFDTTRTPKDLRPGSGDSCNAGEVFYDAHYIYVCVVGSTNNTSTIKKAVLN